MALNRDKVNVCESPADGYTSRHDCHHPTENPSLPTQAVGHRDRLGSDNTYDHMSTSKCCTMLADMATILERLNVLENSSDQCKDRHSSGTAYCLELPLDVTDVSDSVHVESYATASDIPDDLLCRDVDFDIDTDGELLMTDPLCSPTFTKNDPGKRHHHGRSAWDVADHVVVDSPSKHLLPQRGQEGEFEELDAGGDGNVMQQLASCQRDGSQFIDGSRAAETEEKEETSEAITNRVAWEVDITDLVARKGRKPRKTASTGKVTGSYIYMYLFTIGSLAFENTLCMDNDYIYFTK